MTFSLGFKGLRSSRPMEKGRPMREGGSLTGKILRYENGSPIMQPGTLKATKAIGWFIDEYGIAQVSMNMTNINVTPLHKAFDEVCRAAAERGVRVTGTEIVGLIPKRVLIEAGEYFLHKQQRSTGIPEEDIIKIAIHSISQRSSHPRLWAERLATIVPRAAPSAPM